MYTKGDFRNIEQTMYINLTQELLVSIYHYLFFGSGDRPMAK